MENETYWYGALRPTDEGDMIVSRRKDVAEARALIRNADCPSLEPAVVITLVERSETP